MAQISQEEVSQLVRTREHYIEAAKLNGYILPTAGCGLVTK